MVKTKEAIEQLLAALPDDVTIEDVEYHIHVLKKIRDGQEAIREGRVIPHEGLGPVQAFPRSGRPLPEARGDDALRDVIVGDYRVIYEVSGDDQTVSMTTVVHGAREIADRFRDRGSVSE